MADKNSCTCSKCVNACKSNPGWMSPEEAKSAIAAGLGDKLMCDWYGYPNDHVFLLAPATTLHEGKMAPDLDEMTGGDWIGAMFGNLGDKGRCTLLNNDDRCSIHDSGFKPIQCRLTLVCGKDDDPPSDNKTIAALWKTPEAQEIVSTWLEAHGLTMDKAREKAMFD